MQGERVSKQYTNLLDVAMENMNKTNNIVNQKARTIQRILENMGLLIYRGNNALPLEIPKNH